MRRWYSFSSLISRRHSQTHSQRRCLGNTSFSMHEDRRVYSLPHFQPGIDRFIGHPSRTGKMPVYTAFYICSPIHRDTTTSMVREPSAKPLHPSRVHTSVLPDRGWNSPPPLYQFIAKEQFFTYNLGKFLKYITFSSCSLIIFKSLPKLYLKNCFFQLNFKMEGVSSIHDLGAVAYMQVLYPGPVLLVSPTNFNNLITTWED